MRGNKTPVGFRLYDGLRSRTASSNQFPENDDDEVPTVSPIAAALASLPPFVVNRDTHGLPGTDSLPAVTFKRDGRGLIGLLMIQRRRGRRSGTSHSLEPRAGRRLRF